MNSIIKHKICFSQKHKIKIGLKTKKKKHRNIINVWKLESHSPQVYFSRKIFFTNINNKKLAIFVTEDALSARLTRRRRLLETSRPDVCVRDPFVENTNNVLSSLCRQFFGPPHQPAVRFVIVYRSPRNAISFTGNGFPRNR